MKKEKNNSLLFSMLLSRSGESEMTLEDLRYLHCPSVCECQIAMYLLVIRSLSEGMSYEEIYNLIDNIDIDEYKKLNDEAKVYVKKKIRNDVNTRRKNELKNGGMINNE